MLLVTTENPQMHFKYKLCRKRLWPIGPNFLSSPSLHHHHHSSYGTPLAYNLLELLTEAFRRMGPGITTSYGGSYHTTQHLPLSISATWHYMVHNHVAHPRRATSIRCVERCGSCFLRYLISVCYQLLVGVFKVILILLLIWSLIGVGWEMEISNN